MAGSMSRSFRLLGASWTLLGKDLKLLLMPLISLVIACLAAWVFWALGLVDFASERSGFANPRRALPLLSRDRLRRDLL
jgi:hypothetical protein